MRLESGLFITPAPTTPSPLHPSGVASTSGSENIVTPPQASVQNRKQDVKPVNPAGEGKTINSGIQMLEQQLEGLVQNELKKDGNGLDASAGLGGQETTSLLTGYRIITPIAKQVENRENHAELASFNGTSNAESFSTKSVGNNAGESKFKDEMIAANYQQKRLLQQQESFELEQQFGTDATHASNTNNTDGESEKTEMIPLRSSVASPLASDPASVVTQMEEDATTANMLTRTITALEKGYLQADVNHEGQQGHKTALKGSLTTAAAAAAITASPPTAANMERNNALQFQAATASFASGWNDESG